MFTSYNKETASPEDRIAWALCQIIDDDAPMRWTRYRGVAVCISCNPELMADLQNLASDGVAEAPAPCADTLAGCAPDCHAGNRCRTAGVTPAPAPSQSPRLRDALWAVRWDKSFNSLKERTQDVVKAALTDDVIAPDGGQKK